MMVILIPYLGSINMNLTSWAQGPCRTNRTELLLSGITCWNGSTACCRGFGSSSSSIYDSGCRFVTITSINSSYFCQEKITLDHNCASNGALHLSSKARCSLQIATHCCLRGLMSSWVSSGLSLLDRSCGILRLSPWHLCVKAILCGYMVKAAWGTQLT
jgi:hypothetical protein